MSTNFPTNLDAFSDITCPSNIEPGDRMNDVQDAVEAVEAKVGKDGSAVTTSHSYKLSGVTSTDKAASLTGTEELTNKQLTAPKINHSSTTVTADSNEINVLDGAVAGSATASKAVVLDANKDYAFGTGDISATRGTFTALSAPIGNGHLINGKISVTVSSNNLTIAIKAADGTDPSASNPVHCIINNTIRTLTSATAASTVTLVAGNNYFAAGGTGLATNEIDYFMYIGWRAASTEIFVGAARFPDARVYGSFSGTITNAKYLACSTTPASTDDVVCVGRFAATLSAGAGYTWTVPTYTNSNFLLEPVRESRWLTWTPTLTGWSSAPSNTIYQYRFIGSEVECYIRQGTANTSDTTTISFTAPFPVVTLTNYALHQLCRATDNGTDVIGVTNISSGDTSITFGNGISISAWTGSGNKRIAEAHFRYRYI